MGNSCYMNAAVQALRASPLPQTYIAQSDHKIPVVDQVLNLLNAKSSGQIKAAVSAIKKLLPSYDNMEPQDAGQFMAEILGAPCLTCGTTCDFLKRYVIYIL